MNKEIVSLRKVSKWYGGQGGLEKTSIFNEIDFSLKEKEIVGLFAPSGSGKTTFLQIAGLLDTQIQGNVFIFGSKVAIRNDYRTSLIRRQKIGFVFQFHHLLQEFSAVENVIFPLLFEGVSKNSAVKRATYLLKKVGMEDKLYNRPAELSGGEQQRVAICRAIINKPALLLADEPTGNLDQKTADSVMRLLIKLLKENNLSGIIASHNPKVAEIVDRRIMISNGKVSDF
tara:strand:- start:36 stop:722 length:687 start_codon:yes stop_codon:yes gene_type:complete